MTGNLPMGPLSGRTIVITRSRDQAGSLVSCLGALGADCVECPTIQVVPPDNWAPLDQAVQNLSAFDWIVFTSANGVHFFFERLSALGGEVRALGHLRTAAVGSATAQALSAFGIKSDLVPERYHAESLADAFAEEDIRGKRILIPHAEHVRPVLARALEKMGAGVIEPTAYRTVPDTCQGGILVDLLKQKRVHMVTFTSSSTALNFKALFHPDEFGPLMAGVAVAAIGPVTAATLRELHMEVGLTAEPHTVQGLCDAIIKYYQNG